MQPRRRHYARIGAIGLALSIVSASALVVIATQSVLAQPYPGGGGYRAQRMPPPGARLPDYRTPRRDHGRFIMQIAPGYPPPPRRMVRPMIEEPPLRPVKAQATSSAVRSRTLPASHTDQDLPFRPGPFKPSMRTAARQLICAVQSRR